MVILVQRFNYKSKWNKIVLYICITNNKLTQNQFQNVVFKLYRFEIGNIIGLVLLKNCKTAEIMISEF